MRRFDVKPAPAGLLALCVVLAGGSAALAADDIFLLAAGQVQGAIRGEVTSPQFQDHIEVNEIHHLIRAEGSVQIHEPLIFTKRVDRSSPNLYLALDKSELLTLEFKFTRRTPTGTTEVFYTVRLTNARIEAIEPISRNNLEPANLNLPHMERVRVNYQRIEIAHVTGGGVILDVR